MKERPILFSGPMVRAILAGKKTQTRRIVKPRWLPIVEECLRVNGKWVFTTLGYDLTTPYGEPGDRLWVRETFCPNWCDEVIYKADGGSAVEAGYEREPSWKPSIHMPRKASRILLALTGVRVERLQSISEKDAEAEGCGISERYCKVEPRVHFSSVWEEINGLQSWLDNPWVWVLDFRRIE